MERKSTDGREVIRRRMVSLCLIFFITVVITGPLRKWISPEDHQYIAFMHMPILALIYFYCLMFQLWPKIRFLLAASILISISVIILAVIQAMSGSIVVFEVATSAWIGYFAFIPLCYIIADYFTRRDVERFAVVSMVLMFANAAIMYVQKDYRMDDAINQGFGETSDNVFSGLNLIDELTRPMGLFTSPLANSIFITLTMSLCWAFFITSRRTRLGGWFFWPALIATGASLTLAGSRYAVLSFALMIVVTIGAGIMTPRAGRRIRGLAQALAAVVMVSAITLTVFGENADILSKRFSAAWTEEEGVYRSGTLSRLFLETDIDEILENMGDTPFLGYGLGTGSNAAYILGHIPEELYREAPWAKHVNDLGVFFAALYIALRIAFVIGALTEAVGVLRRYGDPAALVLLSQSGVQMAVGQTASHVVVGPLTWLFFGLLLAWTRQARAGEEQPTA